MSARSGRATAWRPPTSRRCWAGRRAGTCSGASRWPGTCWRSAMDAEATAVEIRAEIAGLARRDTPSMRTLRRSWSVDLKPQPAAEIIALAQALERASPQEGKWVAYELIRFHLGAFTALGESQVEDFASRIASW